MAVRKLKNSWWVDFRVGHIRHRKRSPENCRAGAEAYEALLRHRLAAGEPIDRRLETEPSFAMFVTQWFEDYVRPNNKPSEQRTKSYILRASLIPFFGRIPIGHITARDIERYKAVSMQEGVTNKTINNRLTILRKCLSTAYEWLGLGTQPPAIKWLKCPPPTTGYLTDEECDRLLKAAAGVVFELILLALHTGMRQGELKGLQWSSIDWQTRTITVRHSKSDYADQLMSPKSNRERHIPMHDCLYPVLWKRRQASGYVFTDADGKPFDHRQLTKHLAQACAQAGVRRIGWHALRHTFASHLAMRGVPLSAVQSLLGHSSITTTMRYAHIAPSTLRTAIELLGSRDQSRGQQVGNQWTELQKAA